jgi:hypothetical protein
MPRIVTTHDVDDVDHWLAQPTREEFFGELGVTNLQTYKNPDKPNQVALSFDIPELDTLMNALGSPEAAEAMKKDGVRGDTLQFFVEA